MKLTNEQLDKVIDELVVEVGSYDNVNDFIIMLYRRWCQTRPPARPGGAQ